MKILWISPFLLHPTRSGGQIRSLGTLRQLHQRNHVHVVAFELPGQEEGVPRMKEYCSSQERVPHALPERGSLKFLRQAAENLRSPLPLTIARDRSRAMQQLIAGHMASGGYDVMVCDFLSMAVNVAALERAVLFQHNVETIIWRRMAREAPTPLHRWNYTGEARKMFAFERDACRRAKHVIAVSESDAASMREMFGAERVSATPTGVDIDYFHPPADHGFEADLVFTGSLNWIPNIEGLEWFVSDVLPLIRRRRPDCTLAIAGRNPTPAIRGLCERDSRIRLHADVPDIRPHMWGARAAIVPLKVGGGTRLKIYEAMAAGTPQVSTTIGAEGLVVEHGSNILLADAAADFAEACLLLIENPERRNRMAGNALRMVAERFGWLQVGRDFERILQGTLEHRFQ